MRLYACRSLFRQSCLAVFQTVLRLLLARLFWAVRHVCAKRFSRIPYIFRRSFMKLEPFVLAGVTTAALLSTTISFAQVSATPSSSPIKNVVLVHGLFADGSSWQKVIPLLQERGL